MDYIEEVSDEFRFIRDLHKKGKPYTYRPRVGVLHAWGKLRSWTLSGHFHETYMHDLIHVNESLSGLALDVEFIGFDDIKQGALEHLDAVINAGYAKRAWSGGQAWEEPEIVERLIKWVQGADVLSVSTNLRRWTAMIRFSVWPMCWGLMKTPGKSLPWEMGV